MVYLRKNSKMKDEIVLYQSNEQPERIEVRLEKDTVWLNRLQLAVLFGRDVKTIGKHINNVFSEEELLKDSTVANFATVQNKGGRSVERVIEYDNLDVIISVGYLVKSKQGTQFRIWAINILRDYLLKGYTINQLMSRIENNVENLSAKVNELFKDNKVGDYLRSQIAASSSRSQIVTLNLTSKKRGQNNKYFKTTRDPNKALLL